MKILLVHNKYRERGGEDAVFGAELSLLRREGNCVLTFEKDNRNISGLGGALAAAGTIWSSGSYREIGRIIDRQRPDVVHIHNYLPLVSPSVIWSAARQNVPVVQTLHNYRSICLQGMMLRDGVACDDCVGRSPLSGVMRGCYRKSVAQSAVLGSMVAAHRAIGTFHKKVSIYIALSEFSKVAHVRGGLAASKIVVKPNFAVDRQVRTGDRLGFLYVGRLSPEKGLGVLAGAMHRQNIGGLRIAGSGAEGRHFAGINGVTMLGHLSPDEVAKEMGNAIALVFPSICFENFPLAIVEAYASGLPVIGSKLGSVAELIEDGETGLLVEPGSPDSLASAMRWAAENPSEMARMGRNARAKYERQYSPARNYALLMDIYRRAIDSMNGKVGGGIGGTRVAGSAV